MVGQPRFEVLAAVDVMDGRAVRPSGSAAAIEPVDPLELARAWQDAGAAWIHLVDVDAAFGRAPNRAVLDAVVAALDVRVQMSGGIGDEGSVATALRAGANRCVVGTAALTDLEWVATTIARHGDQIAVGLDVRGDRLFPRGRDRDVGDLWSTLTRLDDLGCARYVVTDVATDGAMSGPNLDLLRAVCAHTTRPVVASGGVATLDDLRAVRMLAVDGLEGVIVGTALASGAFTLEAALAAVED